MKRLFLVGTLSFLLLFAFPVLGADPPGLVPCDGKDCGTCELIELGDNLLRFFVTFSIVFAGVVFAWGGLLMVTSGGNMGQVSSGKSKMTDAVVGIVIVLTAWLLMDTVLKLLLDESKFKFGTWNSIQCSEQSDETPTPTSSSSAGSATYDVGGATLSENDIQYRLRQMEQYEDMICEYASLNSVGDQCALLVALAAVESSGNSSARSDKGAVGLMQMTVGTARGLEPDRFADMSDVEVRLYLSTLENNVRLGVKNFADLDKRYNGDTTLILAAYNGGPEANGPSQNCPGMLRWQCEWDNDERTQRNTGYEETRNYVANITTITPRVQLD